jgi:phosphoribosylaminoimidazole-succinocarboxamide synthase
MTTDIVKSISERYIELYEQITGETFVKPDNANVLSRVEAGIKQALTNM